MTIDPQDTEAALSGLQATLRYVEEAVPLGLWHWDVVSGQVHWSAGTLALFGLPAGGFGGRYEDFARQVHPADLARVERERDAMVASGRAVSTEYRIVRPDGGVRWLAARVRSQAGPGGAQPHALGVVVDVTEARLREQALLLQQQIIDNMAEGVLLCSAASGLVVFANPRYEAMLGYGAGELLGQHGSIVNSPAEADPLETALDIVAELLRVGVWTGTVRNRRKDGRDIWVRVSIATFEHHEHGRVWVNVCADITDAHQAQEARDRAAADLQRLSASAQETIEAERAALSRDLHDQLGAALAGIRMRLEAVAARLPAAADGDRAEILSIARMAQDATVQTREICSRLRPPALDDLGIVETCRWYVAEWARHAGLRVKRQLPRLRREPGPGVSIDLFRILQELLTNVVRHARASRVSVALHGDAQQLVLHVADDGIGITAQRQNQGFGLIGVRERAQRHGGGVVIESGPGGTSVTVTLPRVGHP